MYTIVPLAGPDFYNPAYGIKPLIKIDDIPLVQRALESRNWNSKEYLSSRRLIFVVRTCEQLAPFKSFLSAQFPNAQLVELQNLTRGALCSAVAGTALISDFNAPLVVDLVDILYESGCAPQEMFSETDALGILPWFESDDPAFSYLEIQNDRVIRAVEKKVISRNASAGTYFFRDLHSFIQGFQGSLRHADAVAVNSNLFLCPSFCFLDGKVVPVEVKAVRPISKNFK